MDSIEVEEAKAEQLRKRIAASTGDTLDRQEELLRQLNKEVGVDTSGIVIIAFTLKNFPTSQGRGGLFRGSPLVEKQISEKVQILQSIGGTIGGDYTVGKISSTGIGKNIYQVGSDEFW